MKSIKNTLLLTVLTAVGTLAACGGGGDSSSQVNTPSPTPTAAPATPQAAACTVKDKTVTVPKNDSCTHSNPKLNQGQKQTFTCNNGTVTTGSNGNLSAASLTLGDFTYQCAP